jgi:nicotinamidase/pyrazinamidase
MKMPIDPTNTSIILVDIQADFTEVKNGNLKVPGTDQEYIKAVEQALRILKNKGFLVIATQDWHPPNHISFFTNHPQRKPFEEIVIGQRRQTLWPPHCVQNTEGAKIIIRQELIDRVVKKGQNRLYDSYSAFQDDGGFETELGSILKTLKIQELVVFGLAIDYCVFSTIKDAIKRGYPVHLILELSRGVDPKTTEEAIEQMKNLGVHIYDRLSDFLK